MLNPKTKLSPLWHRYTDIMVDHAEGPYIYSTDGERYLDFTSGIAVTNTGHCHPRIVAAIQTQASKLIHGQVNIFFSQSLLEVVNELSSILPTHLDNFFFSNSGAEAVESSVKLARHATRRTNIIVFQGSFHGRTVGAMSLTTSNPIYRAGYQPLMAGVFVAPYPYSYYYGWSEEETSKFCLRQLNHLLASQTSPAETAAVLIEPILGEGGYVVPPANFLIGVQEICRKHGILFIVDEVQTGFGRTGEWFAHQHFEVEPDVVLMAKGLASGFPLSAVAGRSELMGNSPPGSQGGTYGGNAVSCAAAAETIRVIRDEGLVQNSARLGVKLIEQLSVLKEHFPVIGDVRGLGLMVGVEFTATDGEPNKVMAKKVIDECLRSGLVLLPCGTYGNVIRWIPPLIITEQHLQEGLDIFKKALQVAVK